MKRIILFFISTFVVSVIFSQHYPLTHLNFEDGLTRASFFEIAKDPQGYMWLGSETAIIRYDGTDFIQYAKRDGIDGNYVLDIDFDENGHMWISTYGGGVAWFDGKRFWSFNTKNGFPSDYIRSATQAANGDWWLCAEDAGPIWVPKHAKPVVMNDRLSKPIKNPWYMLEDKKGNIWVAAIGGLGRFIKEKNYKYEVVFSTNFTFTSIAEDKDGAIWSGGAYEFIKVIGDSVYNLRSEIPYPTIIFDMLFTKRDGKLHIGASDKLLVSEKDTFSFLDTRNGISNAQFWDVYEDEMGSIWLASGGGGILKYDTKGISWYTAEGEVGFESAIQDIVEDNQGRIIFGTELDGYFYFQNGTFHRFNLPEINIIGTGYGTAYDEQYNLTAFTSANGSILWTRNDKIIHYYKSDRGGGVTTYGITFMDSLSTLHTTDGGCYILHKDSAGPYKINSLPETFFRSVFKDDKGYAWVTGDNGDIYQYKDGKSKNFQSILNPDKWIVLTGYYDDYYKLYFFCTTAGLIIWNGEQRLVLHAGNGLGADVPGSVTRDHDNNIWIGHDKGLTSFNPVSKVFRYVGYDQGFRRVAANFRSILISKNGDLFTSSVNELYKINIHDLEPDSLNTQLRLQEISHRDQIYFKEDYFTRNLPALHLNHQQNSFQIDLAALDFVNAKKVKYAWKLEGFDDEFTAYTHLNEINYTNLPPGDYVFVAKAIDSEGFATNEVSMKIHIEKPFWEKIWFYLLEVGVFMLIVALSFIFSGSKSNNRFGQIMTFLTIIIFFESLIFYLSDFINPFTNGIPVFQLVMNIVLAAVLQPVERIVKRKFNKAVSKSNEE